LATPAASIHDSDPQLCGQMSRKLRHRLRHVRTQRLERIAARERHVTSDHLVQHDSERVQVCSRIDSAAGDDLTSGAS
jgi:hypothetical protein